MCPFSPECQYFPTSGQKHETLKRPLHFAQEEEKSPTSLPGDFLSFGRVAGDL